MKVTDRLSQRSDWTQDAEASRAFRSAAVVYAVGTLIHTADHIRRGTEYLTAHVEWAGNLGLILAVIAITLILSGHRLGPLAAVAVAIPHGLGIAAVHLLPRWSAFSDAFPGTTVSPLTWVAVLAEVVGALATGIAGAYVLGRSTTRLARG